MQPQASLGTKEEQGLSAALEEARRRYAARNPVSLAKYRTACEVLPGGNTRTVLFYKPFPLVMARGQGCMLWDVDGHQYTDFLSDHTAGLFGHSHPTIRAAVREALDQGINLGAHNRYEVALAALICARFPSIELARFTNSGTEANLLALSLAKVTTRRHKVLVFEGSYHGSVLAFGTKARSLNVPFAFEVATYNDIDGMMRIINASANSIAAVIVEPMLGSGGCIPADVRFLQALRDLTTRHGIILIFDEVMTSRLAKGGLQETYGVRPDLTSLGKYVGGGLTFGAFGGRADLMSVFDPQRADALPHAGTFNNNVVSMAAGVAALSLYTDDVIRNLNLLGDNLRASLNNLCAEEEVAIQFTGFGSMLHIHFRQGAIRTASDIANTDGVLRELFFMELLDRGIWLSPRGLIALSVAISETQCVQLTEAVRDIIASRRALLRVECAS